MFYPEFHPIPCVGLDRLERWSQGQGPAPCLRQSPTSAGTGEQTDEKWKKSQAGIFTFVPWDLEDPFCEPGSQERQKCSADF